jgi:hypothetical protein
VSGRLPKTTRAWVAEFARFFAWCHSRLLEVFDASGCRELWLQGEAYRYFRHHRSEGALCVWTNEHKKNDLAFYRTDDDMQPEMVMEIKLLGNHFYTKTLTGFSDMRPYRSPEKPRERFTFDPALAEQHHPREGSLLKDYAKLLSDDTKIRLLMLVHDMRNPETGLGRALQCVDFGHRGLEVGGDASYRATIWEVN